MNGVYAVPYNYSTDLIINQWANVRVSQKNNEEEKFIFSIEVDNVKRFMVQNERAQPFHGVSEFWSDPWTTPANAKVRNITVRSERGLLLLEFVFQ